MNYTRTNQRTPKRTPRTATEIAERNYNLDSTLGYWYL